MTDRWSAESWDERYSEKPSLWSGKVNPALEEELAGLEPGSALEVALRRGWRRPVAGRARLAGRGSRRLAGRARPCRRAGRGQRRAGPRRRGSSATSWRGRPPASAYDLVSAVFLHLPLDLRTQVYGALAQAVRPGRDVAGRGAPPQRPRDHGGPTARARSSSSPPRSSSTTYDAGWHVVTASSRPKRAP